MRGDDENGNWLNIKKRENQIMELEILLCKSFIKFLIFGNPFFSCTLVIGKPYSLNAISSKTLQAKVCQTGGAHD
ncbi:MAG: hypothetical protein ACK53L_26400, partial [Pirellulaceae bacterium]